MQQAFIIAFFVAMVFQVIIRAPYSRQHHKLHKIDTRAKASEQLVLAVLTVGGLILPLIYALTSWVAFADYPLSSGTKNVLGVLGLVLLFPMLWLYWRAHHDLGAYWSPSLEVSAEQQLVTNGIYGSIRHPMYASQLVNGIAQALLLQNWVAGLGGLIAFLLIYFARVPKEEQMMLDHFGNEYQAPCTHRTHFSSQWL
jgi:protein-S-isoprenylcysteine O-methyltransferase Ste14